jgi:hypothetical protein
MGDEPDHTPLRIRDCARRMRCFGVCQSFGSNCDDSAPGINLVIVGADYFRIADNAGIDQSMTPSALIGSNPTDESIVSGLPVILDNIHFGQHSLWATQGFPNSFFRGNFKTRERICQSSIKV